MSSKILSSGEQLRNSILAGVDVLAEGVSSTLGPRGRNVIIKKKDSKPFITKDGVTVAKFVSLDDPVQDVAVEIVKQASAKTNIDAGDGTTTSTVLAHAIFAAAVDSCRANPKISPNQIKIGLNKVCEMVCKEVEKMSTPIKTKEDIQNIATISANNDPSIGEIISTAIDKIGKDGSITVEEARSSATALELVEGFRFDSGFASSYFITDERRNVCRHEESLLLVTDAKIEMIEQILPALEIAARESRPLIIIADEIEGQALAGLIMNAVRGSMKVVAIKAPNYGDERRQVMEDLAIATGAKYFKTRLNDDLKQISLTDFGTCDTIEVSKYGTVVVGGSPDLDQLEVRLDSIKSGIEETNDMQEAEFLQDRLSKLSSGIAIIKVGAPTEVEMTEKKHRIEDALEAVKSAQLEGIIPGGGIALWNISKRIKDLAEDVSLDLEQAEAVVILEKALRAPFLRMCQNSGLDTDQVEEGLNCENMNFGFNFLTEKYVDMIEDGILDPVRVTKCALTNAVSVAGTLLTTDFAVVET